MQGIAAVEVSRGFFRSPPLTPSVPKILGFLPMLAVTGGVCHLEDKTRTPQVFALPAQRANPDLLVPAIWRLACSIRLDHVAADGARLTEGKVAVVASASG